MQNNTKEKYSINRRFFQFLEYENITRYVFSKKTGVSEVTLGNIAKMKTKISTDVIEKLLNNYEVSPDWLLTGKGEMLKNNNDIIVSEPLCNYKIAPKNCPLQQIPLFDANASAGIVSLFRDNNQEAIDYLSIPNLPKSDGAIFVTGDSMYPLLKSGDIVIYKSIIDTSIIIFGEMYIISIDYADDDFTAVKYIQKSKQGDDHITLVSYNQNHQPFDINKKSIKALALVRASIRINSM